MGHLINPLSNRLSINSFWNSNWSLVNTFNYVNLFKKDFILFQFLNWFTRKPKFGKFNIIISHYKVFRIFGKISINFYYYNASAEEKKRYIQLNSVINLLKNNIEVKKSYSGAFTVYKKFNKSKNTFYTPKSVGKFSTTRFLLDNKVRYLLDYIIKNIISYFYWFLIRKAIKVYVNIFDSVSEKVIFNVYNLSFLNITSNVISTYITLKLQQKYSLNWILRPVIKDLTSKVRKRLILGFKIVCSGRFTRKQIATYSWNKFGSLKISSFSSLVKYSESCVRLKYGLCGIKVWLNYGSNNLNLFTRSLSLVFPLYTPFKYIVNFNDNTIIFFLNYWYYLYFKVSFIKSRDFNLYSTLIKLKTKIYLRYLIPKLFEETDIYRYSLNLVNNNKLILKLSDCSEYVPDKDKFKHFFFV